MRAPVKHRANSYVLNQLRNEVPGGVELADEAAKSPEMLRVTPTQRQFMVKLDLIDYYGGLETLSQTSIRLEPTK
jgi:hypothetical protein